MKKITFESDQVKVKTGHKVDGSGDVSFVIGEYQLENIKDLTTVRDAVMKVTVEIEK